jgi:hypothetical protein
VITLIEGLPAGIIGFEASGEVSADDYRRTLDPLVKEATSSGAKVRALAVLGTDVDYKSGAMLEDARLGLKNWSAWERIAIVSDDHRLRETIHLLGWMVPGEVRAFSAGARGDAVSWLSES